VLTPAFSSATTNYTRAVGNATTQITVTPTAADATATITVNGIGVTSGEASANIALSVGDNTIATMVTAQDESTQKTYTILVTRAAGLLSLADNGLPNPVSSIAGQTDQVSVRQLLSPNGDGVNDFLVIEGITNFPENKLTIMNRNGQPVFEAGGYNNSTKVFDGRSNITGAMQLPGTYFYSLDYIVNGVNKHRTGFIVLKY